jgi:hypothetical protein
MRGKLQVPAFLLFTLVLAASIIYNWTRQADLMGWPETVLLVVILLVAVGDQISRLIISPKEVSIETRTTEQRVRGLEQDLRKIDDYVAEDRPQTEITDIISDTLEHPRDTWSKLLLIRMTLRRLLRKIADGQGIAHSPTASISGITSTLHEQGVIDSYLAEQVERIRSATFLVEWGAGQPPSLEDVKFALEKYSQVFEALKVVRPHS